MAGHSRASIEGSSGLSSMGAVAVVGLAVNDQGRVAVSVLKVAAVLLAVRKRRGSSSSVVLVAIDLPIEGMDRRSRVDPEATQVSPSNNSSKRSGVPRCRTAGKDRRHQRTRLRLRVVRVAGIVDVPESLQRERLEWPPKRRARLGAE